MDALTPLEQLKALEATQRARGSLPGWSVLPWPIDPKKPMATVWFPVLDISESEEEYLIQADLPGVKKDAVKIIAEQNTLTITGARELEKEAKASKRLWTERAYGTFGRRFSLPEDANSAKVSTEFIDGVLSLHLAKMEKSKPHQEAVVDEITVWWQKALGTKAVLGQASNRPTPGPREPAPKLLWTKPESGQAQQERKVVEATPGATAEKGANSPGTQERNGHLWMDRSPSAVGQLKHWSTEMVIGAVFFLATMLLRFAGAVFVTVRVALDILRLEFRRGRRWLRSVRSVLLRTNPHCPGEDDQ